MKTLYLYIADEKCTAETKFYFVPVGISKREQSQLKRLQRCAACCPHIYIKKMDRDTSTFLHRVARSIWDGHKPTDVTRLFRDYNIRKTTPSNAIKLAERYCIRETNKNLSYGQPT